MKQVITLIAIVMVIASCKSKKNAVSSNPEPVQQRTTQQPTKERGERAERKGPPSIEEVFKMDTNNDGKLSKSEVKGRLLKDFSNIDSNNDGFISKTEFKNAPRPKRGSRPKN